MNARKPISATLLAMMFWPTLALGQQTPAGIVTTLEGNVTATRASLSQPVPLKFRDEVFLNDRITTGDRSIARVLLGGRAVVTVRERSVLTITEIPGRSTINLESGKIGLAVAKDRMRPGESIDVRTPNAVAGIRGTVVVVDVSQATAQAGSPAAGAASVTTNISTLTGDVAVTFLGPLGQTLGSVNVGPNMFSTVTGLTGTPRTGIITPEMRAAALAGLQATIKTSGAANADQVKEQVTSATAAVVNLLVGNAPLNLLPPPPAPPQRTANDAWTKNSNDVVNLEKVLASSPTSSPPPPDEIPATLLINDLAGNLSPAINTNTQPPTVNPNPFLALEGDSSTAILTIPSGQAPVNVPGGQSSGTLFQVLAGHSVDLARPLLDTASAVSIGGNLANVEGSLSLASSTPTVQLRGTNLTVANNVARVAGAQATMDVNGTFLRGSGASITTGTIASSSYRTNGDGCCSGDPAGLIAAGSFPRIAPSWTDWVGGVKFSALSDRAVFTWQGETECCSAFQNGLNGQGPYTQQLQIRRDGTIVMGWASSFGVGATSHQMLTGVTLGSGTQNPLAVSFLTGAPLTTGAGTVYQTFARRSFNLAGSNLIFTPNGSGGWDVTLQRGTGLLPPIWEANTGTQIVNDDDAVSAPQNLGFAFPLLGHLYTIADASTNGFVSFGSFGSSDPNAAFIAVTDGGTLRQTGTGPLIELLAGTSFVSGGAFLAQTRGGHVSLSDSLLRATDSNLTVGGGLVLVEDGSDLTMNGTNPLVVLSGGEHTIGNNTTAAMFQIAGRSAGGVVADTDTDPNTDLPTGLTFGADRPVRGPASGPITAPLLDLQNSANVSVVGNASAISIDTALLEATAPLIRMTSATMSAGGDVVKLVQHAKLTANVPNDALVSLSAGNLTAGNLVALGNGTRLNVIGDLLRLANNSTASLTSLLNLSGNSVASINGALVRFLGTGNVLNITNSFVPTAMIGGVPVYNPGGTFTVGTTALVGLGSAGVININGIRFDPTVLPNGSLVVIQGTGSVRVGAPRNGG